MSRDSKIAFLIAGAICVPFLVLFGVFGDFILDDAFISFRYAVNLVDHGSLAWNAGEAPVEGYTSFLWVLLTAGGLLLSLDPVIVSKSISALCGLGVILLLARALRESRWDVRLPVMAALGLSPHFALLSAQGMETALTTILVLAAAVLALETPVRFSPSILVALDATILLAFLARPDTAAFSAGLLAGVAWRVRGRDEDCRRLPKFLLASVGLAFLLTVYMSWRIRYFGHFFPNTYYIKGAAGHGLPAGEGIEYALSFLSTVGWPYLAVAAWFAVWRFSRKAILEVLPVLAGLLLFAYYITTIDPIQGTSWRFIFPVFPAALLALGRYITTAKPRRRTGGGLGRAIRVFVMMAFFLMWPLKEIGSSLLIAESRSPSGRIAVGRRLAGLEGTLLTSESGAVPYYSGWRSVDLLGLNSEEIAHEGLSRRFLEALEPDLVMSLCRVESGICGPPDTHELVQEYLRERGFVAVVATQKNPDRHHLYFARTDSRLFDQIVSRLRGIEGVHYADPSAFLKDSGIPLYEPG